MAIREKMAAKAQPHLEPGERIQAVFLAQTHSQWWILLFGIGLFIVNRMRTVAVTDRRIVVLEGSVWSVQAKQILRSVPRQTPIGPGVGLWYRTEALGEQMYIHKRFHKDLAQADALRQQYPHQQYPPQQYPPQQQ